MKPYKVLCTDKDPNWLQLRHEHLTASDVAALLGESPWKTREQLLAEKSSPLPGEWKDTRNMWHGRFNEDHNRKKFSHITGIRSRGAHAMLASSLLTPLACTLDAIAIPPKEWPQIVPVAVQTPSWISKVVQQVMDAGGMGLLEMKQTEAWYGKEWKKGPPMHYWIQVQTQLFVTQFEWAILCCQIGAADMIAYFMRREPVFADELERAMKEYNEELSAQAA